MLTEFCLKSISVSAFFFIFVSLFLWRDEVWASVPYCHAMLRSGPLSLAFRDRERTGSRIETSPWLCKSKELKRTDLRITLDNGAFFKLTFLLVCLPGLSSSPAKSDPFAMDPFQSTFPSSKVSGVCYVQTEASFLGHSGSNLHLLFL